MTSPIVEKLLFGWCERGEHKSCPGKKRTESKSYIYLCTCKHHGPMEVVSA